MTFSFMTDSRVNDRMSISYLIKSELDQQHRLIIANPVFV